MWKQFFVVENVLWKRSFQAGKGVLDCKPCYASLLLQKPKPCPINCITSSKGDLYGGASMEIQQVTSLPQAINKAFTVSWHLLEPIVHNLIFPPFSFHSVNKETTYKKPDTGQTVSCWHHSDLGIILPLWNAEQASRLLVQFWKEVGEAKAKQDALQWNALKKTKYFNQYLNSSNVGQNLLISLLTTEATREKLGLIYTDMKVSCSPRDQDTPYTFIYHVSAVLLYPLWIVPQPRHRACQTFTRFTQ